MDTNSFTFELEVGSWSRVERPDLPQDIIRRTAEIQSGLALVYLGGVGDAKLGLRRFGIARQVCQDFDHLPRTDLCKFHGQFA